MGTALVCPVCNVNVRRTQVLPTITALQGAFTVNVRHTQVLPKITALQGAFTHCEFPP